MVDGYGSVVQLMDWGLLLVSVVGHTCTLVWGMYLGWDMARGK